MQTKRAETILYSTVGVAVMLVILIAVNALTGAVRQRADLTQEKAYTLSAGTKAILKKLDGPVKIRFYCTQSETATPETVYLKSYARRVEDLLREYRQVAGKNLLIEKFDPQPDSDAEDSARLDGLEPQPLPGGDRFYLGLAVTAADAVETIPFLRPNQERLLEYDVTRAISRAVNPQKPSIGILSGLPVFGMPANPMMMQMGQQGAEPWTIVNELRADFNVQRVGVDADKIDDDIKVLLVIHPKDISDKAQFAIDQFVMRGGKLIAFLDPFCVIDSRGGQGILGNMGGTSSNLEKLLKAWGYDLAPGKVVADLANMLKLRGADGQPQEAPAWLNLGAAGINPNDIVTSGIESIWMPLAGAFTGAPAPELKETVLLRSSKDAQLVEGMLANLSGQSILGDFKPSGIDYRLGIRLTGKFKTAFPDGKPEAKKDETAADGKKDGEPSNEKKPEDFLKACVTDNTVVLFADADMLNDNFALRKYDSPFGQIVSVLNGNLSLAQNLADQMTGDNNLIAVRSRAESSRPFTRVKEMQARAQQKFQAEIRRLEESAAEAQRKVNELQAQKSDRSQQFILSPEQRKELENLRKEEAETRKRLKQVQKDLRREVVSLETKLKWINILAMPAAVTAAGLVIAVVKRKKTSAK